MNLRNYKAQASRRKEEEEGEQVMYAPAQVSRQRVAAAAAAAATGRQANTQCGCRINNTPRLADQTGPTFQIKTTLYSWGLVLYYCVRKKHTEFPRGDNTHLKSKHLSLVCREKTRGASGASGARANDAVWTST